MIKAKYIERIENDKNILEEDRSKLLEEAYQIHENAINRNNEFLNNNIEYHPCVKEFLLGSSYRWALESYNDGNITALEHLKKELNRLNIPLRTEEEYNNWGMLVRHINKAHNKYANYQPAYDFYQKHIDVVKQTKEPKEIFEDLKKIDKDNVVSFITLNRFLNINVAQTKTEDIFSYLDKHFKNKILRLWNDKEDVVSFNELINILTHECYVSEKKFLLCLKDIFKNTKIMVNDRDSIKPLELDFVIPKFKLAIEYNGGKFHEDKFLLAVHNMTALEYHSLKREKAKEQGLNLIFVWDDIFYERPLDIINLLEAKDFANPLLNQLEPPRIESRLLLDEE